jgi:hypothetical protein
MLASFMFFSPFTMIVGGALIASPIIIHLINRMRFKRIRWAAMEFLLKSQKRSRRRLIIEQLILLLLRILMVLAIALLLARLIERPDTEVINGKIKAVDPGARTITVMVNASKNNPGDEKKFDVAENAKVQINRANGTLADLGIGKPVKLTLKESKAILIEQEEEAIERAAVTRHIIILDDSASMADRWRDRAGQEVVAFSTAKDAILKNIVERVRESNDPHEFVIIKLSQPADEKPRDFTRLNEQTLQEIQKYVRNESAVQPFHYDIAPALKKARDVVDESPKGMSFVLHVVSDFRKDDWSSATSDALGEHFEYFKRAKAQVKLYDVASPTREDKDDKPLVSNDNLAIVDFRPESRIAIKDFPVEFTVSVRNYSNSDKLNVFIRVKVNNEEKRDGSVNIPIVRANDTVTARIAFSMSRTAPKNVAAKGEDDTHKFDGFNLVSAHIDNESEGLAIDNVRYCYVEVRDKIPLLLVDNEIAGRFTKNSESFYLWKLFTDTYRGFDVQVKSAIDLDKTNLQNYAAIILCDIDKLSPAATQKLESFVDAGGGVAFFMGSKVGDPKFYNDSLYKDGKGIFPAPLTGVANKQSTPEQLYQFVRDQLAGLNAFHKKLVIRKEMYRHPAFEKLFPVSGGQTAREEYERFFYGISFPHYYIVDRAKWRPGANVQTLLYLPNYKPIGDYERRAKDLIQKLKVLTDEGARTAELQKKLAEATDENAKKAIQAQIDNVKVELEKYAPYQKALKEYTDIITQKVGKYDNPLHELATWLDVLLEDPGDDKVNPPRPNMPRFWAMEELTEIRREFGQLLDTVKFGDPFYIAKQHGKGRVLAYLASAGASGPEGDFWSPLNQPGGRGFYPPLMKDSVQQYLTSSGGDFFLPLAQPFAFELAAADYDPVVHIWRAFENDNPAAEEDKIKLDDLQTQALEAKGAVISWTFDKGTKPGMYLFEFAPKVVEGVAKKDQRPDIRALTYNFDSRPEGKESDLARASSEDLKAIARVDKIETMDNKSQLIRVIRDPILNLPKQEADLGLSKSQWLYLTMMLILILEQAWAVRLSFHVRNAAGAADRTTLRPGIRTATA